MQTRLVLPLKLNMMIRPTRNHLSQAQHAIADWAKVDDYQAILDLDCSNPNLLLHFKDQYLLRACAFVSNETDEHKAKDILGDQAEILRGAIFDLPWKDQSFHLAFVSGVQMGEKRVQECLKEARRVLIPGGQLLISFTGTSWYNRFIKANHQTCRLLMQQMLDAGFHDVSFRSSRFQCLTLAAHA